METPALREDGTLKDASEMEWESSPGQKMPAPPPLAAPPSPVPRPKKGVQFMPTMNPSNYAPMRNKRKCEHTSANKDTNTGVIAGRPEATAEVPKTIGKKADAGAINRVKKFHSQKRDAIPEESEDREEVEPEKAKKRKKGEALGDILTVFRQLDPEVDEDKGFECLVCV
jgi:hypothetical protein